MQFVASDFVAKAIEIAACMHAGQVDRAGKPYILHPQWVSSRAQDLAAYDPVVDPLVVSAVSWLHDVVEDTAETRESLIRAGIPSDIADLVLVLTKKPGEAYSDYIIRLCQGGPVVRWVKLADLEHNIQVLRLKPGKLSAKDVDRLERYQLAHDVLLR